MDGALLALSAAAMLGLNTAIVRRSVLLASAYDGIVISIVLSVPVFALLAYTSGQFTDLSVFTTTEYVVLSIAGIMNFLGGRFSQFLAIQAVGANLTAPVRVLSALFGTMLGVSLLGEIVGATRGIGIGLLIIAPLIAFARPPTVKLGSLQIARGITFGLTAAATYGGSTFLLRWVLADTSMYLLGAFVAHSATAIVLLTSLLIPARAKSLRQINSTAAKLFLLTAAIMTVAQILRFAALESADTSVVAPLTETMTFFGLGAAFLFNRKTEAFSPLVLLGIFLAAMGAIAITIN